MKRSWSSKAFSRKTSHYAPALTGLCRDPLAELLRRSSTLKLQLNGKWQCRGLPRTRTQERKMDQRAEVPTLLPESGVTGRLLTNAAGRSSNKGAGVVHGECGEAPVKSSRVGGHTAAGSERILHLLHQIPHSFLVSPLTNLTSAQMSIVWMNHPLHNLFLSCQSLSRPSPFHYWKTGLKKSCTESLPVLQERSPGAGAIWWKGRKTLKYLHIRQDTRICIPI